MSDSIGGERTGVLRKKLAQTRQEKRAGRPEVSEARGFLKGSQGSPSGKLSFHPSESGSS